VQRALRENSGLPALERKLSLCSRLGRHEEAASSLRRLRELHPDPMIAGIGRDLMPQVGDNAGMPTSRRIALK
jgi:hypothetical protein